MKQAKSVLALLGLSLFASVAHAGERSVTLGVDGMWCSACGYFVRETLEQVSGVKAVEVSMSNRVAHVVFDDEVTSIEELTTATDQIGFPSILIEADG